MDPRQLPVYREKDRILSVLDANPVVVIESPTGSGKTTQLPLILHEAGYASRGVIGVTQPRRIAAVSVSEYIARQLGTTIPGVVGYKMRFEDRTTFETRMKVMTDGTLLQEIKADPRGPRTEPEHRLHPGAAEEHPQGPQRLQGHHQLGHHQRPELL